MRNKVSSLLLFLACVLAAFLNGSAADLPTLYEYYTEGGIVAGLETPPEYFQLNKKNITLFGGSIHYFRVHPDYWRDRLRKLRAAGFNALETYVPWNLHEPEQDVYDFGVGDNDMSIFLDLKKYLQIAQEEDLFVLLRPSPYICAEWDYGGMPSWLLRYPGLQVRTSDKQFMDRVDKYYSKLIPLIEDMQFTKGGPIIAIQIENEYAGMVGQGNPEGDEYLLFLQDEYKKYGIVELLYTSDGPSTYMRGGNPPGVLATGNFNSDPEGRLKLLKDYQPDKPLMVMEFWTGWFDHWFEAHHRVQVSVFADLFERILKFPSSVNLYMFHGGTNFGFLNGANSGYAADITSYDYDAPLSEDGDYTDKYNASIGIIAKYNKVATKLPDAPTESKKVAYATTQINEQMTYNEIIEKIGEEDRVKSDDVISMEKMSINNNNGQSYGYVIYRHTDAQITESSHFKLSDGVFYDMGIVLLDGVRKTEQLTKADQLNGFGYWVNTDAELRLEASGSGIQTLDIFVENWGRVNYGNQANFQQQKGLREGTKVLLDDNEVTGWEIIALQFKSKWVKSLNGWQPYTKEMTGPKLLRAVFDVDAPADTFLDMRDWGRGVVFINGFNLGRYFSAGPSHTLYIPAPLLKEGENEIIIFELFVAMDEIHFSAQPILD